MPLTDFDLYIDQASMMNSFQEYYLISFGSLMVDVGQSFTIYIKSGSLLG